MGYKKCFNPCDECRYSYSKNGQQMSECDICEFNHYRKLDYEGKLIELPCLPNEEVWESNKRFGTHKTIYLSREAIVDTIEAGYAIGYTQEEAEAKLKEMGVRNEIDRC